MTIIQPNQNKRKNNFVIYLLLVIIAVLIMQGIYLYSQSVTFRHDIANLEKSLREAEASNAEMKNKIFTFFESENIKRAVEERQLIEEKYPQYIKADFNNSLAER
jgi:cell division protein FtsL